jgi:hypothetical protein
MKLNQEDNMYTIMGHDVIDHREDYEKLGFNLIEIPNNDKIVIAHLPENWHKDNSQDDKIVILDENNNIRCVSFKCSGRDYIFTSLKRKYDVHEYQHGSLLQYSTFYFGEDGGLDSPNKLYVARSAYDGIEYNGINEYSIKYAQDCRKYIKECEDYGDKYYPNWRDYNAYWNEHKELNNNPKILIKNKK